MPPAPPTFSKGTEFGTALDVMFKGAVSAQGKVNKRSLDQSFQKLMPSQRRALETPVTMSGTSSAALP